MKSIFNGLFLMLIPFVMAMAAIVIFVFGLVIAFYLIFWGLIVGTAIYVIAWIYRLLFVKRSPKKRDFGPEPAAKSRKGHTYDHDDL